MMNKQAYSMHRTRRLMTIVSSCIIAVGTEFVRAQAQVDHDLIATVAAASEEWTRQTGTLNVKYTIQVQRTSVDLDGPRYQGLSPESLKSLEEYEDTHEIWVKEASSRFDFTMPTVDRSTAGFTKASEVLHKGTLKQTTDAYGPVKWSTLLVQEAESAVRLRTQTIFHYGARVHDMSLAELLHSTQWDVSSSGLQMLRGRQCVLLEARPREDNRNVLTGTTVRLWLDPEKSFLISRQEWLAPTGAITMEIDAEFGEVRPGVWVPLAGVRRTYSYRPEYRGLNPLPLQRVQTLNPLALQDYHLDGDIPDSIFEQPIPQRAYVHDRIRKIDYFVGAGPYDEIDFLAVADRKIDELVASNKERDGTGPESAPVAKGGGSAVSTPGERGDMSLASSPGSSWHTVVYALLAAVLVLGILYMRKWRRRAVDGCSCVVLLGILTLAIPSDSVGSTAPSPVAQSIKQVLTDDFARSMCGPVCLAYAAKWCGMELPIIKSLEVSHWHHDRVSLLDLKKGAQQLGLTCRAVRFAPARMLEYLQGDPESIVVGQFQRDHFLVLHGAQGGPKFVDPLSGATQSATRTHPHAEFASGQMVLLLSPSHRIVARGLLTVVAFCTLGLAFGLYVLLTIRQVRRVREQRPSASSGGAVTSVLQLPGPPDPGGTARPESSPGHRRFE